MKKTTMEKIKEIVEFRGGKCHSDLYINKSTKMDLECSFGHHWSATYSSFYKNWCPHCSGKAKRSIGYCQELALRRNGRCLSKEYVNSKTPMKWECDSGHTWTTRMNDISNGSWCPYCSIFISERICRAYFEKIFVKEFPKCRPKWLKTPKGTLLELDGYCEELGIAFEHQGEQHYRTSMSNKFYIPKEKLQQIQSRDEIKRRLCILNGVLLIEIPALGVFIKRKDLQSFLMSELCNKGVDVSNIGPIVLDWSSIGTNENKNSFDIFDKMVSSKGGKTITKHYLGSK